METYGSIRAPSLRLEVDDGAIDYHRLVGTIDTRLDDPMLTWSLHDHRGDLIYQSTEYTVSDDGCTAIFKHDFPKIGNGDTYTITQELIIT